MTINPAVAVVSSVPIRLIQLLVMAATKSLMIFSGFIDRSFSSSGGSKSGGNRVRREAVRLQPRRRK